jgi:hypothetical protein
MNGSGLWIWVVAWINQLMSFHNKPLHNVKLQREGTSVAGMLMAFCIIRQH